MEHHIGRLVIHGANGSCKMALTRSKKALVKRKSEHVSITLVLRLTTLLLSSTQHGRNPLPKQNLIRKQSLQEGGAH